jgi:ADP-heptose:LPS heptosyltransferase
MKSGLLTAYTGAPLRIGFSADHCRERLNCLFTNRRVRPPATAVHVVDQYLSLLAPLGLEHAPVRFHVPIPPGAIRRMDEFLGEQGVKRQDLLVAINPGAGRDNKQWPVEHFRRLGNRLAEEPNVRILLLWGPDEVHMARQIRDGLEARAILAPPTDLHELAAILRRSALMVANDTGPLHLAAALGTPSLGLFGPTRAERNGPYGVHCRGVQSPDGTMGGLDPQRAVEAALPLLAPRSLEP